MVIIRTAEEAKAAGWKKAELLLQAYEFSAQAASWNEQGNRFLGQGNADAAQVAFRQQDYNQGLADSYRRIAWSM